MKFTAKMLPLFLCFGSSLALRADTLASFGSQGAANVNPNYLGEKFTTSGTGAYNSIAFDFITTTGSPYAIGTGYLLSQEYLGTPGNLSSLTVGYLGSAVGSGGYYNFGNAVTLQSGSVYYLYENALSPVSTVAGGTSAPSSVEFYYSGGGNFVAQAGASAAFTVTGTAVGSTTVTPEPSSLALLATGLSTAVGMLLRRRPA